jgi:hypothetical protein
VAPPFKLLEIFGEGKTDIGNKSEAELPDSGVVAILVHALCGKPDAMRVKRKAYSFLQGKGTVQKIKFAKRQAVYNHSDGVVFVLDTEGGHKKCIRELQQGRDAAFPNFPMAIGAAHPCIEAWLLADGKAIKKALNLATAPNMPATPEDLPAPQHDRANNPKTVLASCGGVKRSELSSAEKDLVAAEIRDTALICSVCPLGFGAFAVEVEQRIKPLFDESGNE